MLNSREDNVTTTAKNCCKKEKGTAQFIFKDGKLTADVITFDRIPSTNVNLSVIGR